MKTRISAVCYSFENFSRSRFENGLVVDRGTWGVGAADFAKAVATGAGAGGFFFQARRHYAVELLQKPSPFNIAFRGGAYADVNFFHRFRILSFVWMREIDQNISIYVNR